MSSRTPSMLAAALACCLACTAAWAPTAGAAPRHPRAVSELVGRSAPLVLARGIRKTTPVKLKRYRGRPLLLVFFATWCRPCRAIEPALEAFVRRLGPKRITLLALSHEARSRLLRSLRARPAGYLVAQCTGRTALRYAARSIPTLVLIDKAGVVRAAWQGLKPRDMPRVLRVVAKAAGAAAPER